MTGIITSNEAVYLGITIDANNRACGLYTIAINSKKQINIVVANNGYIVTAYPTTKSLSLENDDGPSPWMHI